MPAEILAMRDDSARDDFGPITHACIAAESSYERRSDPGRPGVMYPSNPTT
jgi:hypothetical protein